ncbi:outer dense fiber protein 4 [Pteronotus mesoamericanus]|uniref:outer dense fiber protein 4 n=1 Tax=Pteronotus mesoamericanus TaxID=1884717 RepID=UPI0023EC9D5D|nr:outer dense fiber protein 4 [Pteronotus parnellii mesoamericanus]
MRDRQSPVTHNWVSPLPLQWIIKHTSECTRQALASGLSLIAFILLLIMAFSTKWLCLPSIRFYQRWPANASNGIYTSAVVMSMGLLHICRSEGCPGSDDSEVAFIFSTLLLFPINVWIFELKRNLSIPIGWSYFIGWVVFVLYVTCAFLCYFNNKNFWSLILSHSPGTVSCSSSTRAISLNDPIVSNISVIQKGVLDPEQEKGSL